MSMRERSVQCCNAGGLHRMAYTEWGDAANPRVLLCVHGLTRCSRDFDDLAMALEKDYRIVCPDVVGRGRSDWLADKSQYGIQQYLVDMATLVARLDVEEITWLGTSMGGLIGMYYAAQQGTPIRRLILNDVGPVLTAASLQRIGEYVGDPPRFDSLADAEQFVRLVSASFGPHTDAQWRHLTAHVVRTAADGKVEFRYDPGIAESYKAVAGSGEDIELWPVYEQIQCPTVVLRGAESDLLRPDTLQQMTRRGPRARAIELPGVGHAPTFMAAHQIDLVREALEALA
ncbi:Alpha/beta hydrolase fold protein [Sterolibacterium denitrificans]|uniref:Alpha/beta hydrolase fold protein n=1 Tax=Sterolibacterium denitrificans TaxID=157592 RepID=A0A7Z7HRG9_9PROT|nr:alpha/beta hydrolase [Sterolibacterium denitrificans]SMB27488.1 Alpha/beta hydrolase fold protein [Sterolibacterium denitrificans]